MGNGAVFTILQIPEKSSTLRLETGIIKEIKMKSFLQYLNESVDGKRIAKGLLGDKDDAAVKTESAKYAMEEFAEISRDVEKTFKRLFPQGTVVVTMPKFNETSGVVGKLTMRMAMLPEAVFKEMRAIDPDIFKGWHPYVIEFAVDYKQPGKGREYSFSMYNPTLALQIPVKPRRDGNYEYQLIPVKLPHSKKGDAYDVTERMNSIIGQAKTVIQKNRSTLYFVEVIPETYLK